jgi:4'-phosphopantetheinyl transferase
MASMGVPPRVRLRCLATEALTEHDRSRDLALLDAAESARCQAFAAPEDRREFAAAHALLRRMLSEAHPDVSPADWRFDATARGKPVFARTRPTARWASACRIRVASSPAR